MINKNTMNQKINIHPIKFLYSKLLYNSTVSLFNK